MYNQVLDLFTQFYPEEDNLIQFLVNNHPETPRTEVKEKPFVLPDINTRNEDSVVKPKTPIQQSKPKTPVKSTTSIGIQVDLGAKEHFIPKPSFISKFNQDAYSRTLPTPIIEMRKSLEESIFEETENSSPPPPAKSKMRSTSMMSNMHHSKDHFL
jgi:hypothetical protein